MNIANFIVIKLGRGEAAATPSKEMCAVCGVSTRELRRLVEGLRRQGVPICSCNSGYFLPASLAELDRFLARERKRAMSILVTLRILRRLRQELALAVEFEPLSLFKRGDE